MEAVWDDEPSIFLPDAIPSLPTPGPGPRVRETHDLQGTGLARDTAHLLLHTSQALSTERFSRGTSPHRPLPATTAVLLVPWELVESVAPGEGLPQQRLIDEIRVSLRSGSTLLQAETSVYDIRRAGDRAGGTRGIIGDTEHMRVPDPTRRWLAIVLVTAPDTNYAASTSKGDTAFVMPPPLDTKRAQADKAAASRRAMRTAAAEGTDAARGLAQSVINRVHAVSDVLPETTWHDRLAHLLYIYDNENPAKPRPLPRSSLVFVAHAQSYTRPPLLRINECAARLNDVHYAVQYQQPFVSFWKGEDASAVKECDEHIEAVLPFTLALIDTRLGTDTPVLPPAWAGKRGYNEVMRGTVTARNAAAETTREALAYPTRFVSLHHVLHEYECALALELRDQATIDKPLMLSLHIHVTGMPNAGVLDLPVQIVPTRFDRTPMRVPVLPTRDETAEFMYRAAVGLSDNVTSSAEAGYTNPFPLDDTQARKLALRDTRDIKGDLARQRKYEQLRWNLRRMEARIASHTPGSQFAPRPRAWIGTERALFLWQNLHIVLREHKTSLTPETRDLVAPVYRELGTVLSDHIASNTPLPMLWGYEALALREVLRGAPLQSTRPALPVAPESPRRKAPLRAVSSSGLLSGSLELGSGGGYADDLFGADGTGSQLTQYQMHRDPSEYARSADEIRNFSTRDEEPARDLVNLSFGSQGLGSQGFDFGLGNDLDGMDLVLDSSFALAPAEPEALTPAQREGLRTNVGSETRIPSDLAMCLWRFAVNARLDVSGNAGTQRVIITAPFALLTRAARTATSDSGCASRADVTPLLVFVWHRVSALAADDDHAQVWTLVLPEHELCRAIEASSVQYTLATRAIAEQRVLSVFVNVADAATGARLLVGYGAQLLPVPRSVWPPNPRARDPLVSAMRLVVSDGTSAAAGTVGMWSPVFMGRTGPTALAYVTTLERRVPYTDIAWKQDTPRLRCNFVVQRNGKPVAYTLDTDRLLVAETLLLERSVTYGEDTHVTLLVLTRSARARAKGTTYNSAAAVTHLVAWLRAELANVHGPRHEIIALVDLYSGHAPWVDVQSGLPIKDMADFTLDDPTRGSLTISLVADKGTRYDTVPLEVRAQLSPVDVRLTEGDMV